MEALLTGESDEIEKKKDPEASSCPAASLWRDGAMHGSTRSGTNHYIAKLTREAKVQPDRGAVGNDPRDQPDRQMDRLYDRADRRDSVCPELFLFGETLQKSVVSAIAAVIGMIPEGLYMLTTIALVLGDHAPCAGRVLLHDMKSIERRLARVDVLCVDKTGTITEPGMNVQEAHAFECAKNDQFDDEALQDLLADYCLAAQDTNETMQALRAFSEQRRLEHPQEAKIALDVQPFSSSKKYSAITFETGTYLFGAPEFVLEGAYAQVAES